MASRSRLESRKDRAVGVAIFPQHAQHDSTGTAAGERGNGKAKIVGRYHTGAFAVGNGFEKSSTTANS